MSVFRANHPAFDGMGDHFEIERQSKKAHWDLTLDYIAGRQTHGWHLLPYSAATGGGPFQQRGQMGKMVEGEGTVAQIADQICTVVTNQGANIRYGHGVERQNARLTRWA